ncbi:uncharacterized protein LOC128988104 isoform X2 [Macrosteles quadrilineatus]|nr:uncharacterized protein LOC128988104 isoform X2 [Macrosteles quadrilineatus]
MALSRRNPLPLPPIQYEERLWRPMEWKGCYPGWQNTVCAHCRLNMNHTLASVRWNHRLRGPLCPQHSLDLGLSAVYTHGPEVFPDKGDVIRQPETVGLPTWRLMKNKRHDPTLVPYNVSKLGMPATSSWDLSSSRSVDVLSASPGSSKFPRCVDPTHPLRYGGLLEKRSPSAVKLGISSHHNPQSNNGYSRNSYGAFYTS